MSRETISTPCPACSSTRSRPHPDQRFRLNVRICRDCGGVYTIAPIYRGDSYALVAPRFAETPTPAGREFYFDLDVLGSDGLSRRHGWASLDVRDAFTGAAMLTQVG